MFSRRHFLALFPFVCFALLAACGNHEARPAGEAKTIEDRFPVQIGGKTIRLQLALLPAEMERGLMYRQKMGEDEGMLFLYRQPQPMSFWMRNTELPLDIGYLDAAGELKEIYPMYPHDERPVVSRGRMQFALEMNQGWFHRAGVKTGAKLDRAALAEAIRARGAKPELYGLP